MKLIVITCLRELHQEASRVLRNAGISVFSSTGIVGFKDDQALNLVDNWFSSGSESYDSVVLFSFTDEAKTNKALELIHLTNQKNDADFPIRAFVLDVEKNII
jgi:hypothetical protein